jgi:superoxide dismutase, Cu-Zn family
MGKGRLMGGATVLAVTTIGLATLVVPGVSGADGTRQATLRDPAGRVVGTVRFGRHQRASEVRVRLRLDPATAATSTFHGLHLHANGDPANGAGCVADPTKDAATWFVSADGHWKTDGQDHGSHLGDLPSVFVTADGTVDARFTVHDLDGDLLDGKAVVLHAARDNFGNVPVGAAASQYTPNGVDATTATNNTGNAGARIACGVVGVR